MFQALAARGLMPLLARAGQVLLPQTATDVAFSLIPNMAYAGLTALNQPEGTGIGTRVGAGLEDMAGSLFLQTAGRGAGYGAGRAFGALRGRRLGPENLNRLTGFGELAAEFGGYGLIPRPFASKALGDYESRLAQQQQAEQAIRDEQVRREAIAQAGGLGVMMPPGLSDTYLSSPFAAGFG